MYFVKSIHHYSLQQQQQQINIRIKLNNRILLITPNLISSHIAMFGKIGSVILLVDDMERSYDFYSKKLGLRTKVKSRDWIEFFNSGTSLALHPRKRKSSKESPNMSSDILVGFMVSDLDTLVQDLKAKNIKFFKEPKQEPFGKHTIIVDPDDHLISIAEITSSGTDEGFDLIGFIGRE